MRVDFVRFIDYWFGIPICLVLSVFYRIQKFFVSEKFASVKYKKIMFLEFSEMGSVILSYPAVKRTKEAYPGAGLYFWIFKRNQDSVHILNIIPKENVITMRDDSILSLAVDTIKGLWRIRREKIDVIIDMELFSRFTSILSYLSGAKIRVGFNKFSMEGLYRGSMQTHRVSYNPYMHMSKNFLSLVNSLRVNSKNIPLLKISTDDYQTVIPKIELPKIEKESIWLKLIAINGQISEDNRIIILNPGVNDIVPLRRWPLNNYIELAKMLLEDKRNLVVLIGLRSQFSDAQFVSEAINSKRCINLAGKTSIRELINLCNISHLLVSHDSGAVHLAALTQINIVVLFGPETPVLYAPLSSKKVVLYKRFACSPCITAYNHRRSLCRDNKCLKAITVKEVYNIAKDILNK